MGSCHGRLQQEATILRREQGGGLSYIERFEDAEDVEEDVRDLDGTDMEDVEDVEEDVRDLEEEVMAGSDGGMDCGNKVW